MSNKIKTPIKKPTIYYEFVLEENECIEIGTSKIISMGACSKWGKQAKFGIIAPNDIEIYRLEIFVKKFKKYNQIMEIKVGENITINNVQIELLYKTNNGLLFRIKGPEEKHS